MIARTAGPCVGDCGGRIHPGDEIEGATVQINLPPGTTIADVDKRRLAKLVDAVQPPTAECPICRRHITLTTDGRRYTRHNDKARHPCPMSRQEVIT